MEDKRTRRRRRWAIVGVLLCIGLCYGVSALLLLADQSSLLGVAYVRAVVANNPDAAALLGDHFSDDKGWHQQFFELDTKRDMAYLAGADISGLSSTHEETLSGQPVTVLRFSYRAPGATSKWQQAVLRIKTDKWFVFTYIKAVEPLSP